MKYSSSNCKIISNNHRKSFRSGRRTIIREISKYKKKGWKGICLVLQITPLNLIPLLDREIYNKIIINSNNFNNCRINKEGK